IPWLAAPRCARLRLPRRDCLIGEPDRQAATLTPTGLVNWPIGDLAPLPGDMVAAILVQLEGHGDVRLRLPDPSYPGRASGATGGSMHHADDIPYIFELLIT